MIAITGDRIRPDSAKDRVKTLKTVLQLPRREESGLAARQEQMRKLSGMIAAGHQRQPGYNTRSCSFAASRHKGSI